MIRMCAVIAHPLGYWKLVETTEMRKLRVFFKGSLQSWVIWLASMGLWGTWISDFGVRTPPTVWAHIAGNSTTNLKVRALILPENLYLGKVVVLVQFLLPQELRVLTNSSPIVKSRLMNWIEVSGRLRLRSWRTKLVNDRRSLRIKHIYNMDTQYFQPLLVLS